MLSFSDSRLTVKNLVEACIGVSRWQELGIWLRLPMHQLESIQITYHEQGIGIIKAHIFDLWLKRSLNPSWTDLITALRKMDQNSIAHEIEAAIRPGNERVWYC